MAHVLVVGGTGMLSKVSLFLAEHDNVVSVVARDPEKLEALTKDAKDRGFRGNINPIPADYRNIRELVKKLTLAVQAFGPFTLVLNWMEARAVEATMALARFVNETSPICRFFHVVLGDRMNPQIHLDSEVSAMLRPLEKVLYRRIILTPTDDDRGQRLSDEEISSGTIAAVRNDEHNFVIGEAGAYRGRTSRSA